MSFSLRPFGPGSVLGLLVVIFAILGALGVIPFTALVVFVMIALLALGCFV
jgi:hypothetical protein